MGTAGLDGDLLIGSVKNQSFLLCLGSLGNWGAVAKALRSQLLQFSSLFPVITRQ